MEAKRRLQGQGRAKIFVFICTAAVILSGSCLWAVEQEAASVAGRYRVFSLKHISAEQGKKYLAEAGVGTVSQLPGVNVLLVTAQPEDLIKAKAIIELVDAEELFDVKVISPVSGVANFPSNEQIATEVNDISIGTFFSPPSGTAKAKAIIDVHNDTVIAVAPAEQLRKIVSAIEQLQGSESQTPLELNKTSDTETEKIPVAGPTDTELEKASAEAEAELRRITASPEAAARADTDSNEPLDKLISSIARTELVAEPVGTPQTQPNLEPVSLVSAKQSEDGKVSSYEPVPIVDGNQMLELNLPEKLNIIDLVDLVGKYLQLDYMYDETQVQGEVALKLQGPIKVKDLYPLLESVLRFRGLVMTRRGNLVTIVPADEAVSIDPLLHPEQGGVQLGDVIITRLFKLKYIDTASAQNLLLSMKLGADVTPISETGTLIITEYAYRMARVEELLEMVDQPGEPREFRFRQLKYTMATTLAPKIKTLAEQLGAVSITIAAPSPTAAIPARPSRRGRPAPTPTPAAAAADKEAVYLDSDERTNRILMIGLEEQLAVVNDLIDSLDVEQQDLRTLRLYDIQHVGAEEVVKKLGELGIISSGTSSSSRTPAMTISAEGRPVRQGAPQAAAGTAEIEPLVEEPQVVVIDSTNSLLVNATSEQHVQIAMIISYVDSVTLEQAIPYVIYGLENQDPESLAEVLQKFIQETIKDQEGKVEQTIRKTEENIIIVPDKNTFSILVYASKKNQEWIGSLIKQLDKRRPQVLLDAMLVEIRESDAFDYDLQLVTKFPRMEPGGTMTNLTPIETPFPLERMVTEATSVLSDASAAQGFYSSRHIQALLKLIQTKGYGRVLARPKILVNDNEKGHIDTINTIYVARTSNTYLPNTVTTATPTNTAVTSTSFDQFPSGINLDITPHISEGDLLRLEIKMTRSSYQITPGVKILPDEPPPDKSENNIETIVTVPDDSTIILGGITQLGQSKDNWKVPFLGDIPIAGGLFRKIKNSSSQTKLYIFVKANILRPSETVAGLPDLEKISDRNRGAVEDFERKFQEHQDWPGVEPEPMDPLRVLDSE
ncbi:MAG: secretin N-terminal domain-containing protein [Phycisphaerae bacterium]|nr:secretin N-terminal domain-containing protein [Phycisphaerae bacterium]